MTTLGGHNGTWYQYDRGAIRGASRTLIFFMPRLSLPICLALACLVNVGGCGPATVDMSAKLRAAKLPELSGREHGIQYDEATKSLELEKRPSFYAAPGIVDGLTVRPYVRLLWLFMKMPVIVGRAPDGRRALILFDTGLTPE